MPDWERLIYHTCYDCRHAAISSSLSIWDANTRYPLSLSYYEVAPDGVFITSTWLCSISFASPPLTIALVISITQIARSQAGGQRWINRWVDSYELPLKLPINCGSETSPYPRANNNQTPSFFDYSKLVKRIRSGCPPIHNRTWGYGGSGMG